MNVLASPPSNLLARQTLEGQLSRDRTPRYIRPRFFRSNKCSSRTGCLGKQSVRDLSRGELLETFTRHGAVANWIVGKAHDLLRLICPSKGHAQSSLSHGRSFGGVAAVGIVWSIRGPRISAGRSSVQLPTTEMSVAHSLMASSRNLGAWSPIYGR